MSGALLLRRSQEVGPVAGLGLALPWSSRSRFTTNNHAPQVVGDVHELRDADVGGAEGQAGQFQRQKLGNVGEIAKADRQC